MTKYIKIITVFTVILLNVLIITACDNGTNPEVIKSVSATPASGTYTTAQIVTLTTATSDAVIHYTIDGSNPTTGSTLYTSPITISTTTTLKAIAIKSGMHNSGILTAIYTITSNEAEQPTATPEGGGYHTAQNVVLTTNTSEADIHYTLDGTTPTIDSTKYINPIPINTTTTLKAIAVKTGMTNSDVLTVIYTIADLPFVTYDADGGTPAPASPVTKNPGDTITQPPAMTKDWHTFSGWYTDSDRTVPAVFPITITADVNLYAKWIVNKFTNIANASAYLASMSTNTISNPINLPMDFNLGVMTSASSEWRQLLDAIYTSGKFVNLDLSTCTMSGISFNPDESITTGKDRIISIILPIAAMSIEAGDYSTFRNFTNLKSISGENIFTIGNSAFDSAYSSSNKNLQSINFPQITSIGRYAFRATDLQNVTLPVVTSIDYKAFSDCTNLQSISFPASTTLSTVNPTFDGCTSLVSFTITGSGALSAIENGKALVRNGTELIAYPSASGTVAMSTITSIGTSAFSGCTGLQSVGFPQVTNIGDSAFRGCTNLQGVHFPQATSIDSLAFAQCSSLQTVEFPLVTSIGSQAFASCSNLQSLNIPRVTNIGTFAFSSTGTTALTITVGTSAPTLGGSIFDSWRTELKTVTIKVPYSFASGYTPFSGSTVTVSGTDTTANWTNGLRGGGWTGSAWVTGSLGGVDNINQNISVIIQVQ